MVQPGPVIDEFVMIDKETDEVRVQTEINEIVAELKKRNLAEVKAIQEDDYSAAKGRGIGPVEVVIITFLGTLAKEAATTIWREFIWPSLQLRLKGKIKLKG